MLPGINRSPAEWAYLATVPAAAAFVALLLGEHKRGTPMYSFLDTDKEKKKKTRTLSVRVGKHDTDAKKLYVQAANIVV